MVLDKRRLQIVTAGVLTLLMIVMGLASGTHALTLYRTTLHRQMAENNEIVKANLSIIIDQITRQYVDKTKVIEFLTVLNDLIDVKSLNDYKLVLNTLFDVKQENLHLSVH